MARNRTSRTRLATVRNVMGASTCSYFYSNTWVNLIFHHGDHLRSFTSFVSTFRYRLPRLYNTVMYPRYRQEFNTSLRYTNDIFSTDASSRHTSDVLLIVKLKTMHLRCTKHCKRYRIIAWLRWFIYRRFAWEVSTSSDLAFTAASMFSQLALKH